MRRYAYVGVLFTVALAFAACSSGPSSNGISSESATQIVSTVGSAIGSASSVTITGSFTQSGKASAVNVTTFSGGDLSGDITENGTEIKIVKIGSTDYINAPASYYVAAGASAAVGARVGGKWIFGPDSTLGFGDSFTLSSFEKSIKNPTGSVRKGTTSTINGQSAYSVISSSGTLWVATTGTAYPIQLNKNGSSAEQVEFVNWNKGTLPTAPAGAVSISSLG